ncbi:MAG: methylmalonyl-CoA mutase small subunit [Clostridium sp.]|nr:methylmalonyl-CoA mutase small subunit [Prevotella sp.]MCM1429264.1 methylmalonyl-CoA mutase small subunit [Clostridium sp.]MCM1475703.1 methylmalonyl-CoA mutase small subunit [Muribaculaceae bacterium]
MAKNEEKLFDMFPPVTTEEWLAKINVDLKGADFNKKLVWRTNEGFNVQPLYRKEDLEGLPFLETLPGEYPYLRGTRANNDWLIRQQVQGETPEKMNEHALHILDRGVDSLGICLCEAEPADLKVILKGVDLKKVEVNVNCCPGKAEEVAKELVNIVKGAGAEKEFKGSIGYNPFKRLLKHGLEFPKDLKETSLKVYEAVKEIEGLRCFSVDSRMLNNCGAYITQELGYALAWGAEWMTLMTEAGLSACEAAARIKFNMGISSNYFMELAKFRAARMLWAEIVKAYGADEACCKMYVHAVTSEFNMTIYDAHVNLLRSMTESMSAALAGVDTIETLPFDQTFKRPDEFSERIARNQQILLRDESHLNKVVDPAGGSYYIETLTASIAEVAWNLFNEVEEAGGFYALLKKGEIQAKVNESGVKRHLDVARRKESLLGTNQFPNFNEMALDKIQKEVCSCGCSQEVADGAVDRLQFDRAASQFEQLRLDTERSGKRPKVFMLTIGNLAMRLARAQFSSNFFGCAGYEIIDNIGFETVKEGIDAAIEKGADIVVLCSSDDEYAQYAPEAYKELNGRALFVVAGNPACAEELKAQGIEDFIHVKVNVLDTLVKFNAKLL